MSGETKIDLLPVGPAIHLHTPEGFKPAACSITANGEALRLLIPADSAAPVFGMEHTGFASFPKSQTGREYLSIFSISGPAGSKEVRIGQTTATFPKIEALPGGEVLIVASRCHRFKDGSHELNAKVFDHAGTLTREFLLGDGINHVQTDNEGRIWVGYFDEGVYGNFGWGGAHGPEPIGAWGLSCFNDCGKKLWDFRAPAGFDPISDCYALNLSNNGAWAHYYTDFPIAHIDRDWNVRCWKTQMAGGRTFAILDRQVLLFGGYNENRAACKLLRLTDERAELAAYVSLILPGSVDLSKATVIGRNDVLHVFSGDDWYRFSMEHLV
jgi:hypothetical protein